MRFFRLSNNKKAQVELQVNWIYVLIVGAVILTFFFFFARSEQKSSDDALSVLVTKNMEQILTVTQSNADSSKSVNLHGSKMNYHCSEGFSRISMGSYTSELSGVVLFSPRLLSGEQINTWTYNWFCPYRVDTFLYVSSPKTLYYFVYNGTTNAKFGDRINKSLPKIFNLIIDNKLDLSGVVDDNYDNIKVVFLGVSYAYLSNKQSSAQPIIFPNKGNAKFSSISIESVANSDNEIGTVYFYNVDSNNKLVVNNLNMTKYIGFASLLGAIFSDNKEDYECNMKTAFSKMKKVNTRLYNRSDFLLTHMSTSMLNRQCGVYVGSVKVRLQNINNNLDGSVTNVVDSISSDFAMLGNYNDYLEENSCPLTY